MFFIGGWGLYFGPIVGCMHNIVTANPLSRARRSTSRSTC